MIGLIVIGLATYVSQHRISKDAVIEQTEDFMSDVAAETIDSIKEYPAYDWLLRYWYENAGRMDIEYDVDYGSGTRTEEKCRLFSSRHPEIQLKYADVSEIEALPEADQKLYAEIVYSWMTTRIDQIKQSYNMDFLFCLVTDTEKGKHPYETQFFLLSGADPGAVRGTEYEQVYPLGKISSVAENESQQSAMRHAVNYAESGEVRGYLAEAGRYMDYYAYLDGLDDQAVLIGLTLDVTEILSNVRDQTIQGTSYSIVYQVGLLILIMLLMFLTVLRPLKGVLKSIRLYAETKDKETATRNLSENMSGISGMLTRHNEIGQLSDDVTKLAGEIDDYIDRIETITSEKERISTELELASKIQQSMLPASFPDREEFTVFATMTPARDVGGDFYDAFMIDDDHLAAVIADVSGKGIPAALYMMGSKILVKNMVLGKGSPAEALEAVNSQLCETNREDMFVTVWLGVLELSTGMLTAANAGHEYPVYRRADGHFRLFRDKHGFVIGGMQGLKYKEYEIQMKPGDKLFVYTDGLPEATDKNMEMFGNDRMVEALVSVEDRKPEEILRAVNETVGEFTGEAEQFDDLTMLCIEYRGSNDA